MQRNLSKKISAHSNIPSLNEDAQLVSDLFKINLYEIVDIDYNRKNGISMNSVLPIEGKNSEQASQGHVQMRARRKPEIYLPKANVRERSASYITPNNAIVADPLDESELSYLEDIEGQ